VIASRARELLETARRYDNRDRAAARELPRLDIMRGFLEYRLDAAPRALPIFAGAARSCRELQDWDCYGIASQNLALLAAESRSYTAALTEYADLLRLLPPGLDPKL